MVNPRQVTLRPRPDPYVPRSMTQRVDPSGQRQIAPAMLPAPGGVSGNRFTDDSYVTGAAGGAAGGQPDRWDALMKEIDRSNEYQRNNPITPIREYAGSGQPATISGTRQATQMFAPRQRTRTPGHRGSSGIGAGRRPVAAGATGGGAAAGALRRRIVRQRTPDMPDMPDMINPELINPELPGIDKRRQRYLTEQHMGGARQLGDLSLQQGAMIGRQTDNTAVQALQRAKLAEGLGRGVAAVREGATRAGHAGEREERTYKADAARAEADIANKNAISAAAIQNQNLMNQYERALAGRQADMTEEDQRIADLLAGFGGAGNEFNLGKELLLQMRNRPSPREPNRFLGYGAI